MIKNTPLCELAFKYGSDKCPTIKHPYTPFYYELLNENKEIIKKVLEIGIGSKNTMHHVVEKRGDYQIGASLYMWRDFLPNAQIFGADIDPKTMFESERIKTFMCNQANKEDLIELISKTGDNIEVIIDDGSHLWDDQIFTCQTLMPIVNKDVIYIIEDITYPQITFDVLSKKYDCLVPKLEGIENENLIVVRYKKL